MEEFTIKLNQEEMTTGELELLEKLMRRCAYQYQGKNIRAKLTEHEKYVLNEATSIINASVEYYKGSHEYDEQGILK